MTIARWTVCGVLCVGLSLGGGLVGFAQEVTDEGRAEMEMVIGLLNDEDKEMRSVGLDLVRSGLEGQEATEQLASLLPELSADAKVGLISALADRGDLAARPAVLELLSGDGGEPVRVAAIKALGYLGEATDTSRLVSLLADVPDAERSAARESLVRLQGEGVVPAVFAEMKQAEPPIRVALIEILVSRRALDTIPELLAAAVDDNAMVRVATMKALGQLAGPEHVAGMVQGVLRAERGKERDAAEKAVMVVCANNDDVDRRAEPLLAAYEKLSQADQRALLSALGRVGGPKVLTIVEEAIGSNDSQLHGLGIRAICNWPDASVVSRLTDLATNETHDSHKNSALRALIRVAPTRDGRTNAERLELLEKAMAMAEFDKERHYVLDRARTILDIEALRFVVPYMDQPAHAEPACLSVVELAHHRELRDTNPAEFHQVLDRVIAISKNEVVLDRAQRYKKGETWVRPAKKTATSPPSKPVVASADKPTSQENERLEPKPTEQSFQMWVLVGMVGICVLVLLCWFLTSRR